MSRKKDAQSRRRLTLGLRFTKWLSARAQVLLCALHPALLHASPLAIHRCPPLPPLPPCPLSAAARTHLPRGVGGDCHLPRAFLRTRPSVPIHFLNLFLSSSSSSQSSSSSSFNLPLHLPLLPLSLLPLPLPLLPLPLLPISCFSAAIFPPSHLLVPARPTSNISLSGCNRTSSPQNRSCARAFVRGSDARVRTLAAVASLSSSRTRTICLLVR